LCTRGSNRFGYLLLAPQMIGFTAVGLVAIVWVIWLSLHDVNVLAGSQDFVGLDNYARILTDPSMITVLPNTFFFVCVLSVAGTVIALLLAVPLNQQLRGIGLFRSIVFIPALVTMRSEEHTSELQSRFDLVCRLLLEKITCTWTA